ncbi:hypothetical protein [Tateyamaria sp.]
MDFTEMIKQSGKETAAFAKRNSNRYAVISDLRAARDQCKTAAAAAIIGDLLFPLDKELRRETDAYDKKMSGIWKAAKGEKVPKDAQKKLDDLMKKSADSMKSKTGDKPKINTKPGDFKWMEIERP